MTKLDNTQNTFEFEGTTYTMTKTGYCYKTTGKFDKKGQPVNMRIGKHVFEQAFEEYIQTKNDEAEADEWENEVNAEYEQKVEKKAESDKEAEDAMNGKKAEPKTKKVSKPRKSKDIAFEMDTIIGHVTLTAKQVTFMKSLPGISFWDNGIESTLWCDCIAQDINWNPMSVGAMISTLREKKLVSVSRDESRQGKPKYMEFTEVGQVIAEKLGLN